MISLRDYPVGLVERALRTTPSFRVTEKLGFNKIKEIKFNPISLSTYDVEFTVERGNWFIIPAPAINRVKGRATQNWVVLLTAVDDLTASLAAGRVGF